MNEDNEAERQAVPTAIMNAIQRHDPSPEALIEVVWSELQLENLGMPFQLPTATGSYENLSNFIQIEIMLQSEIMRSNICNKIALVKWFPKEATANRKPEKHLRIKLPRGVMGRTLSLNFECIEKEPSRGQFTNYVYVFQKRIKGSDVMENICLAYSKQMRARDGAIFVLGRDADSRLDDLTAGTIIYARPLVNCSMWKTHIGAIGALKQAEGSLNGSFVTNQMLRGCIEVGEMKKVDELLTAIFFKTLPRSVRISS